MPHLPLDLERLIFETAALADTDHDSRVRLILVAKRVHEWIRPILYRVAIARGTLGKLLTRNWRNAQIADIAPFVRHFLITSSRRPHAIEMLSSFHNVENLAIWMGPSFGPEGLKKMNDLPLRMLSVGMSSDSVSLDEAIRYCPTFKNVTHLEWTCLNGTWNDCKALVEFPKLTHLCFGAFAQGGVVGEAVVLRLLEHCPTLRAMVYQLRLSSGSSIESNDPRFLVLQDHMSVGDFVEEWERSTNGGIGLWELADIIIEARKDKLFKDQSSIFSRRTWMDNLNDDGVQWYNEWMRKHRRNGER